jgi:membrane-bound serine protease (ClpP class)
VRLVLGVGLLLTMLTAPVGAAGPVYVLTIDGGINPAVGDYLYKGITQAEREGAQAVVIELDTPGGLLSSTKDIVSLILNAKVPVIVFVSPKGAWAGSAGMFITLAGHVAAMAPGTSIGAAHPVSFLPGQPPETPQSKEKSEDGDEKEAPSSPQDVMGQKVENFTAAFAESIAEHRERNVDWAIQAVRESVAVTQVEALENNVIDLVAEDLDDLMEQINGRVVKMGKDEVTLETDGATRVRIEMGVVNRVFDVISDPQVALLLILAGLLGLYVEFTQPGMIFPGVAGAVSLILAALALQIIPFNSLGLILILVGVALLIAEIFVTSFGILFAGGLACFAAGGYIMFDVPDQSDLVVPIQVIAGAVIGIGIFGGVVVFGLTRSLFRPQVTGAEGLVGQTAVVETKIGASGEGRIFLHGDLWTAQADEPIPKGEKVRITDVSDLKVRVTRATEPTEGTT